MAVIRLYRKFYKITASKAGELYNLIDPTTITAAVYLRDSSTLIETVLVINKESEGVYYADLNPILYSYDNTYDLKWNINYIEESPTKTLITTFKLNPINIANSISTEINNPIEIYTEIDNQIIEVIIL